MMAGPEHTIWPLEPGHAMERGKCLPRRNDLSCGRFSPVSDQHKASASPVCLLWGGLHCGQGHLSLYVSDGKCTRVGRYGAASFFTACKNIAADRNKRVEP